MRKTIITFLTVATIMVLSAGICFADTTKTTSEYDTKATFTVNSIKYSSTDTLGVSLVAGLGRMKDDTIVHIPMPGDSYTQQITVVNDSDKTVTFNSAGYTGNLTLNDEYFPKYSYGKSREEVTAYFWNSCFIVDKSRVIDNKTIAPGKTMTFEVPVTISGPNTTNVYESADISYDYSFTLTSEDAPVKPTTPTTPTTTTTTTTTNTVVPSTGTPVTGSTAKTVAAATAPAASAATETIVKGKAAKAGNDVWALVNLICTVFTVIMIMILALNEKKRNEYPDPDEVDSADEANEKRTRTRFKVGTVIETIVAIAAMITFIWTENVHLDMVMTDEWTLLMLVMAAVSLIGYIAVGKRKDKDDEDKDGNKRTSMSV